MWRPHPGNLAEEAWREMRAELDQLLAAAERAGVRLGIEPEAGNVVADAGRAHRLLEELGPDSRLVGIVLDPANLVTPSTLADQDRILRAAFADLGAAHGGSSCQGRGDRLAATPRPAWADLITTWSSPSTPACPGPCR